MEAVARPVVATLRSNTYGESQTPAPRIQTSYSRLQDPNAPQSRTSLQAQETDLASRTAGSLRARRNRNTTLVLGGDDTQSTLG